MWVHKFQVLLKIFFSKDIAKTMNYLSQIWFDMVML